MPTRFTVATLLLLAVTASATETENQHLRILPAPAAVQVDGDAAEWDLTGGVFACGDVEAQREKSAVWLHAMYDAQHLYVLARWVDQTPMNNPGTVKGSAGFNGDCLQFRLNVLGRVSHWTCWRDADGVAVATAEYGKKFNEGKANLLTGGGAMGFAALPDGSGYVQEIAIPWKLLTPDGVGPKAGERIDLTFEPNFSISGVGRLSIKDLFRAGVTAQRVFTFMDSGVWGTATLAPRGRVEPQPVRLSDTREFAVRMEGGLPTVDWTGLIKSDLPAGFKPIKFTMPADGYVSMNLFASDGTVARQLLTNHFFARGDHEVLWDGLTTPSHKRPGTAVPAGTYTWQAITHTGIGLKLRGWAASAGATPWEGWGGDHGNPIAAAADAERVYLGWAGGEGSKPLIALDLDGKVLWRNIRGGIADAQLLAADGKHVFVFNSQSRFAPVSIYKLDAKTGKYADFTSLKSTDLSLKQLIGETKEKITQPDGLAAGGGKLFASFASLNAVLVIDAETGELLKKLDVPSPTALNTDDGTTLLAASNGQVVYSIDVRTGTAAELIRPDLGESGRISCVAEGGAGEIYVGVHGGRSQVLIYTQEGQFRRAIGRLGGRVQAGPWDPNGVLNVAAVAGDVKGRVWVMENSSIPRRVSVWSAGDGQLLDEHFGPSSYGAQGGAINPVDPNLMVGQGFEWQIDPATGKAKPTQSITTRSMATSRFGFGPDQRLYLATTNDAIHGINPAWLYERTADGYKLRTVIRHEERDKKRHAVVWADENDDQIEQPDEKREWPLPADYAGWITGWYMPMTPDLAFYGSQYRLKVAGFTACGAPRYDFSKLEKMPAPARLHAKRGMGEQKGHGSADGRFMLYNGDYNTEHSTFECYDLSTGRHAWTYPNNYTGVHGSHKAPGPITGMIRGAYDITGAAKLPVVGNVWVIPANKGEWHVLSEKGFYLTHLFQTDPMKWAWPEKAVPGVDLTNVPPGAGEEAFGGSITQGVDGKLYVQAGHTSFWNVEVTGLETIREIGGGKVTISDADLATAAKFRADLLQAAVGTRRLTVRRATPAFTGDLSADFKNADVLQYKKTDAAAVRTAACWDDKHLYVAWQVKDDTPWINGADAAEFLYARGDTVDLQLGTDLSPHKDANAGDLRLSIGPFNGKPTAVLYRKVAAKKNPKTFSSGTAAAYTMESVTVLTEVKIEVNADRAKKRYTVQAAIAWAALGISPKDGLKLRGDFGVTHSDRSGGDTALRTHWSNQDTGLVSDEVYELHLNPANWGELNFAGQSSP